MAGSLGSTEEGLENNLQRELRVVRLAGADARSAVGNADRRGAPAKRAAVTEVVKRLCQVDAVEHVGHPHAELRAHAFLVEGRALNQGQIHVSEAGSDDLVAGKIAVGG